MKKHIGGVMVKRLEESKDVNTGAMKIKWCVYVLMYSRNKMQYNI
jgi:hypothetical protein